MYQLLKQILVTGSKTEAPPLPDEALRVTAERLEQAMLSVMTVGVVVFLGAFFALVPRITRRGLLFGVGWAMTATDGSNWHPLTWLAHMADCQVYGLWAGGHHLTNVALHAAAVVVLAEPALLLTMA